LGERDGVKQVEIKREGQQSKRLGERDGVKQVEIKREVHNMHGVKYVFKILSKQTAA